MNTVKSSPDISRFTTEEDRFILKQRNERAKLWVSIANDLGAGRTANDVKNRYDELTYESLHGREREKARKVKCLGHGPVHQFMSPDPKRFRICPSCTEANKLVSAGSGDFDISDYSVESIEIAEALDKKPAELAEKDQLPLITDFGWGHYSNE